MNKTSTVTKTLAVTLAATLLTALVPASALAGRARKPRIQIAMLLDTSGSMSGLIDQARTQLWKVVNEFQTASQDNVRPDLQVALYEYGKSSLAKSSNWIRQVSPLTTDLDAVSESLFSLRTNGGNEYCGAVIESAVDGLQWSTHPHDLKVILIAGNEAFTQGPVDYRQAMEKARARDIVVNTLHCGSERDGIKGRWADGARLADGTFLNIDQNRVVAHFEAPQDAEIARLGKSLNKTYVAYGRRGMKLKARQAAQDRNAEAKVGSMMQRAVTKASAYYDNAHWDLVDASKDKGVDSVLAGIGEADMPEELKGMDEDARRKHVEKLSKDRMRISKRIQTLNKERASFVTSKRKETASAGGETFDSAMMKTIRSQAEATGFSF